MHPKTTQKLKNLIGALIVVGGVAWWQQGRIRYWMGLGGSMDAGVRTAVQSLGKSREAGDYAQLLGLMSSEYQKGRLGDIDRMRTVLAGGTDAQKKEVRKQLARMGLSEEDLNKLAPEAVAARMVKSDVDAHPEKFPMSVETVDKIEIDRNIATVLVKTGTGGQATLQFIKQDGVWKLRY